MPRNTLYIKSYVEQLLANNLIAVEREEQHLAYGYAGERVVYHDPILPGMQVVVVCSQYDVHGKLTTGHPNLMEEALNYIEAIRLSAHALIEQDDMGDVTLRKEAINQLAVHSKQAISLEIPELEVKADLFSTTKSTANTAFLDHFKEVQKHLQLFTQVVVEKSGHKVAALEKQGHLLRSVNRATQVHRFVLPGSKEGEEQFIMYIPCGRYTKRQQELMGKNNLIDRAHDTTSHNRDDLVLGNSSMVRMIVGTRHADGSASIYHDSFSGPGARMPYADFKGADAYKKLVLKAITLINQEEIIQALAQRHIDCMSDEALMQGIPELSLVDKVVYRAQLIDLYLKHNPLTLTECYSQVVSAGQKIAAENQKEQFEYVLQMMDAFDGDKAEVSIQTGFDSEIAIQVDYFARMSSWGVNWFRHASALNPLSDYQITQNQNTRFINQMTDDALKELNQVAKSLADSKDELEYFMQIVQGPDVRDIAELIRLEEQRIIASKSAYRQKLFAYYSLYLMDGPDNIKIKALDFLINDIQSDETDFYISKTKIYDYHVQIEEQRKALFINNKEYMEQALSNFRKKIISLVQNKQASTLQWQHFYNLSAYLIQAQALYYEDTWHEAKNNFKLQTLTSLLAEELGFANTKGCKSNNDRGQRLAQKISGNVLWTALSEDGLHTGEFLDYRRTQGEDVHSIEILDRELTCIQALHHTANTGVSGGKFAIQDKQNFADNGLWGKIASFAKVKNMTPESAWTKNMGSKAGKSTVAGMFGAGVGVPVAVFSPLGGMVSTALGVGVLGSVSIVGVAAFAGIAGGYYFINSLIDYKKVRDEKKEIKSSIEGDVNQSEMDLNGSHTIMNQVLGSAVDKKMEIEFTQELINNPIEITELLDSKESTGLSLSI